MWEVIALTLGIVAFIGAVLCFVLGLVLAVKIFMEDDQ